MKRLAAGLVLLAAGCPTRAPLPPPATAVVTVPPAPAVTRLRAATARARREGAAEEFSVAPDGTATRGDRVVARIADDRVVDAAGATLATVDADGTVRPARTQRTLRLEGGDVLRDDGVRLTRDANGRVVLRHAAGAEAPSPWTLRTEAPPDGVATALLALALVDGLGDASRPCGRAATDAGDAPCPP